MSRQLNPSQVWSQVPVANRLIEVNTKTGFSLTAGSYSVRASSNQQGTIATATNSGTAAISAVTVVRATVFNNGQHTDTNNASEYGRLSVTSTVLVTFNRSNTNGTVTSGLSINELF